MMKAMRFSSLAAMLLAVIIGSSAMLSSPPAQAIANGNGVMTGKGFDACSAPSSTTMQKWFTNTPWSFIGVYIGGSSRGCSQPNLTSSWFNTTRAQGWRYELIWVGPQAPCTTFASRISSNTTTAYNQGKSEASAAWSVLVNQMGFTGSAYATPVVYDMESYPNNSACRAAVKSFMRGWTNQLATNAMPSGVYGSACGSYLDDLATNSPPPKFIVPADWDGNPSTSAMVCITGSHWYKNHQRIKQYQGDHNETWGGVTINIDSQCADGPMAPSGGVFNTVCY